MPMLDVSDVLLDPMFAEALTIERRTDDVGSNGRVTSISQIITPQPFGVVVPVDTAIGGNALERTPDEQHRGAALEVYTTFRLRGPSPDGQPDIIIYDGSQYIVTIINTFARFGAGFIKAECSSMNSIDDPPT